MRIEGSHFTWNVDVEHADTIGPDGLAHREFSGERTITGRLLPGAPAEVIELFNRCEAAVLREFAAFYEAQPQLTPPPDLGKIQ